MNAGFSFGGIFKHWPQLVRKRRVLLNISALNLLRNSLLLILLISQALSFFPFVWRVTSVKSINYILWRQNVITCMLLQMQSTYYAAMCNIALGILTAFVCHVHCPALLCISPELKCSLRFHLSIFLIPATKGWLWRIGDQSLEAGGGLQGIMGTPGTNLHQTYDVQRTI